MFNKLKPYLCWGSVTQQKAIANENANIPDGDGTADIRVETLELDEIYLPRAQVCFNGLFI